MAKRPSLAETMRQVAVQPPPQQSAPVALSVVSETAASAPRNAEPQARAVRPYFAATRAGKKKVTVALSPAAHKQLKGLAVEHETKSEALLAEAIRDLFAKYGKPSID